MHESVEKLLEENTIVFFRGQSDYVVPVATLTPDIFATAEDKVDICMKTQVYSIPHTFVVSKDRGCPEGMIKLNYKFMGFSYSLWPYYDEEPNMHLFRFSSLEPGNPALNLVNHRVRTVLDFIRTGNSTEKFEVMPKWNILATRTPGYHQIIDTPECILPYGGLGKIELGSRIIILNDNLKWTREQIADWLDELADAGTINIDFEQWEEDK